MVCLAALIFPVDFCQEGLGGEVRSMNISLVGGGAGLDVGGGGEKLTSGCLMWERVTCEGGVISEATGGGGDDTLDWSSKRCFLAG